MKKLTTETMGQKAEIDDIAAIENEEIDDMEAIDDMDTIDDMDVTEDIIFAVDED